MKGNWLLTMLVGLLTTVAVGSILPPTADAHCDTMDGPVVNAARMALEKNDVDLVLIWVKEADEPAIREAFQHDLAVRRLGAEARELADRWFFETLVRLHRAGEGAPFTGLEPAGSDNGPGIRAADRALESGDLAPLVRLMNEAVQKRLDEGFKATLAARKYSPHDVAAGRKYVESYVSFIHQAEAIWLAVTGSSERHDKEGTAGTAVHPGEH